MLTIPKIVSPTAHFLVFLLSINFCKNINGTGTGKSLGDSKFSYVQDVEHMKKDLDSVIDIAVKNISIEHMQFYFFRLHDFNNDQRLDGNELFVALRESSANEGTSDNNGMELEAQIADAVDALLEEADQNDDGLISWREYLTKVRSFVGEPTE